MLFSFSADSFPLPPRTALVGMYRNDILILLLQQPVTQFLRYLHSLFGGDFIRGERLYYVLCFGGASTTSETLSDGFCLAHKRLDKRMIWSYSRPEERNAPRKVDIYYKFISKPLADSRNLLLPQNSVEINQS